MEERRKAEDISAVLYPNDATEYGKQLRLKQQYFFVSASIQVPGGHLEDPYVRYMVAVSLLQQEKAAQDLVCAGCGCLSPIRTLHPHVAWTGLVLPSLSVRKDTASMHPHLHVYKSVLAVLLTNQED